MIKARVCVPVLAVFFCCVSLPLTADEWMTPEPTGFCSRGFSHVAEIFPPHTRQNQGDRPLCYFYELEYPGPEWKIEARLKWKAELVNERMPYEVVVSMDGDLVTMNEHGRVGYENSVVIYNRAGKLVRAWGMDEMFSSEELQHMDQSTSSRWWNQKSEYYFLREDGHFYVTLPKGRVLQFSLKTGDWKAGMLKEFPEFDQLLAKNAYPNENAQIMRMSLRFSSVTDVLAARGQAK